MICNYGCNQQAKYQLKNKKLCCSKHWVCCPEIRRKNIEKQKGRTKENCESVKRMSQPKTGRTKETYEYIKNQSKKITGRTKENDEGRRIQAEKMTGKKNPGQKDRMKSGGAIIALRGNKRKSKPELKLREIVKDLYPTLRYSFPILNYEVDIIIPEFRVVIEYDGSYWHQDKEYHTRRQKEIEMERWKFIRYVDKVPTKEQILEDMRKMSLEV